MGRWIVVVVLAAGLLGVPAAGAAQAAPDLRVGRYVLQVSPVVGVRSRMATSREATVIVQGRVFPVVVESSPGGGPGAVIGVDTDLRLLGPIGVSVGALYLGSDALRFVVSSDRRIVSELWVAGAQVWLARADLSYRLPEVGTTGVIPSGFLLAGPAWVREDFATSDLRTDGEGVSDRSETVGIHIGYRGVFPLRNSPAELQLLVEDYVPMWRSQRVSLPAAIGSVVTGEFGYDRSHIPMASLGLSFHL